MGMAICVVVSMVSGTRLVTSVSGSMSVITEVVQVMVSDASKFLFSRVDCW